MRPPLSLRVGCSWRREAGAASSDIIAPRGFIQYRRALAQAGAPLTFRVPSCNVKLAIRCGCIGAAAMSGRYDGVVTPSNALMCGNRSAWWGFMGHDNVDGLLRSLAGPGLGDECDAISPIAGGLEKLTPSSACATGAHDIPARHVIHVLAPASAYPRKSAELALRRSYSCCLRLAADLQMRSIALPALGCGVAGFPADTGARTALDAIEDAAALGLWSADDEVEEHGSKAPARVEFVLRDERVYNAFADAAHARWGGRPAGGKRSSGRPRG